MAKIKGNNVRLYLGADLLMHTKELTFNFNTDTEEVTDADSGIWKSNLPTTNGWDVSGSMWYNNAVASGADYQDLMDAWLAQTELTIKAELETGVDWSGLGYITNLAPAGGTAGSYAEASVSILGTDEIS